MHDKSQWYKGVPFGCGQCLPCRINRRRIWTLRMALEYLTCKQGLFITLTYADDSLPFTLSGRSTLCKKDFQDFMKRFRKAIYPRQVRYFACGEYGSKTERPHYHAIIFGVDETFAQAVADNWHFGMVACGSCTVDSIQYVAGYCLKKLVNVKKGDERVPEFILTSRRPGLGVPAIEFIADAISKHPDSFDIGDFANDVPGSLSVLGKNLPLGRFMISKLREAMGIDSDRDVESQLYFDNMRARYFEELEMYRNSRSDPELLSLYGPLTAALMSEDSQRAKLMEGTFKIFNKRNKI